MNEDDLDNLTQFFMKSKMPQRAADWVTKGLRKRTNNIAVVGEIIDGNVNGVLVGCTLAYWYNVEPEILPLWLGIRVDRIHDSPTTFTSFMDKATRLLSANFEKMQYFSFYLIRRLPKRELTREQLARISARTWAMDPYITTVERVIRTQEDFDNAPSTLQAMIGKFTNPVVVLFFNLNNEVRESRTLNSTVE